MEVDAAPLREDEEEGRGGKMLEGRECKEGEITK